MYKVEWDKETGGVVLNTSRTAATVNISPRPVFCEELDLIGLNNHGWTYPTGGGQKPLLWAVNKSYWYRGEHLFDVKGANIYTKPTIVFCEGVQPMELQPIDVEGMLAKCSDLLFVLESEAIEFIRHTFNTYTKVNETYHKADTNQLDYEALAAKAAKVNKRKMAVVKQDCDSFDIMPLDLAEASGKQVLLSTKIDKFICSFSGGKDSQVVLDLCTRALSPSDYDVIYSDTGYELPPSLKLYEEVQRHYHAKYPTLKFHTARNHESVINYWDKIGTPSDTHRWCCSVMKTAPLYRMLKVGEERPSKFLAFEGVRAEESIKRSDYGRIGKGVKHSFVINARPILSWSTTEVFLYLFRNHLPINQAYRVGKPRVGCILCPFGSPWDDMIVNECYKDNLQPFLSRIEQEVKDRNIPNGVEYITERKWNRRGSGKFSNNRTTVNIELSAEKWKATINYTQKDILEWLPALGEYTLKKCKNGFKGELLFKKNIFPFEVEYKNTKNSFVFTLYDSNNVSLRYLLRRLINKTAYCINCEACENECPTGALSVYPTIRINKEKCVHCHRCLEYHNVGCIVADSLIKPQNINTSNMKIAKYYTFGLHQEWLEMYLTDSDQFFSNQVLGAKQMSSFKAWLNDAEIIDEKSHITPFGELCKEINRYSSTLIWELVYINLVHNSSLINWYVTSVEFNKDITRKELNQLAIDFYQKSFRNTTITYAVDALVQTFKYSPLGSDFAQYEAQDSKRTIFRRTEYSDLSPEAVAYSIYKYAHKHNVQMLSISDLYRSEETCGVYKEFGINREAFAKKLRHLSSMQNRVLTAELNMGLEHITLREDLDALSVIEVLK